MKNTQSIIVLLTILINLSIIQYASCTNPAHPLIIQKIDKLQNNIAMTKEHYARRLQGSQKWRQIKIYFDMTQLFKENPSRKAFYEKVYDIVGNWWHQALWVRDDKSQIAPEIKYMIDEGYISPFNFKKGKKVTEFDLLIHNKMAKDEGGTLAWAGPYIRHPGSQRPITGQAAVTWFGDQNFKKASDSVNRAVGTIIHEFAHVIAFTQFDQYQKRYVDYDENLKIWLFKGPKVMTAGAKFYNCSKSKFKGMPIETFQGGVIGAHWSEVHVNDELMSPISGEIAEKVSPMTMALFEDTNWYKANWQFVEHFTFRKGEGCAMLYSCPSTPACETGGDDFIISDFKGVGYCSSDSNDCAREVMYTNRNCMKPAGWGDRFSQFGASYDENCVVVQGQFIRQSPDGQNYEMEHVVSVRADCASDFKSYTLTFKDYKLMPGYKYEGNAVVKCDKAGDKVFNSDADGGIENYLVCHDPSKFCGKRFDANADTDGVHKCDKSCMKNGKCHPGSYTSEYITDKRRLFGMELLRLRLKKFGRELQDFDVEFCSYAELRKYYIDMFQFDMDTSGGEIVFDGMWNNNCKVKSTDSGSGNGGSTDSGSTDSGSTDSGSTDSGSTDSGSTDSGSTDSGSTDSGSTDSGSSSGGSTDSGSNNWKCWCYSNYSEQETCPALKEDQDGIYD